MKLVSQPRSRKGSVAVLVRKPLGISVLESMSSPQLQLLRFAIHGAVEPLTILCSYRVPDEDTGFQDSLQNQVATLVNLNWATCLDGNQNQLQSPLQALLQGERGKLAAVARHNKCSHTGIWLSQRLLFKDAVERPGLGNRSIASCAVSLAFQKGPSLEVCCY